ncbi:MAG TPA: glycosyltransferase family 1 protein [Terriglobia bacterium]|nr:glycosyltransferase family 1 protein [Terriglobia bacterium]
MRLAINAGATKMGGAVTYLSDLLRHLPPPESGHEFLIMLPRETVKALPGLPPHIKLFPTPAGSQAWWKRLVWDQVTLRRLVKRMRADVLYSAANFGLLYCPVPQVLLLQNPLYFSDVYHRVFLPRYGSSVRLKLWLRRWLMLASVRHSDLVMTPTQALLDGLRRAGRVSPAKTMVNPYGVSLPDEARGGAAPVPSDARQGKAAPSVGLLYVSLYTDYKNLGTLLKALPLLNHNGGRRFALTTTVNPDSETWPVTHGEDMRLARSAAIAPLVRFSGRLTRQETLEAYRRADIFVFPSMVESFGFPMAEAMAVGLPVVAADTELNREICGDAALYFEPLDPQDLASQVERVASDRDLQARLSAAGRQRVTQRFRWEDHVRRLIDGATRLASHGNS